MRALRRLLARLSALLATQRDEQRLREEFQEHIAMLTEDNLRSGLSPEEARRQAILKFGSVEAMKDACREQRVFPWLESLASDVVFGWRQVNKHRAASAAAILSLALAIGATTAAFRLVDAVLLRPLPVAEPERLFFLAATFVDREGRPDYRDSFGYRTFHRYRETVGNRADVMAVGVVITRQDVTFSTADETERLYRQYLSGNVFGLFGLQAALGRLLTPNDDLTPGAQPVAVLSYDYWTRRFGRDPGVLGKTFRIGNERLEIVGVAPRGFTGTEPGEVTDVFIPVMMNVQAINNPGWLDFRIWVRPKPGVSLEEVRQPLQSVFTHERRERVKGLHSDTPRQVIDAMLGQKILLLSASTGASRLQRQYRRPMLLLAFLVALVLLVACVNVANLLTAQASARAREMALRVSLGAGRWRLVQLVLVESALLALGASALGGLFASWAAPLVTSMLRVPGDPVRLIFDTGRRELAFGVALALLVTVLFGLAPALRASGVHPISALKGAYDPHSSHRLMNALLAAQVAFSVLVLFVSGLFLSTFQRLSNRPLGFSSERLLIVDASAHARAQPPDDWTRVADHLRHTPGVESVSVAAWPLLSGNRWTGYVRLPGRAVEPRQPYFLEISPGFFETMRIGLIDGRDVRPGDLPPRLKGSAQPLPGVGIVNEAFARTFFNGENPTGRSVDVRQGKDLSAPMEIIGYVRDAAYADLREPIRPTVYVPMGERQYNTFLVRAARDPHPLATILRREISRVRSDFRVHNIQTPGDFVRWQMVRERLLAALSLFFSVVALVLAAVGLYGVLNYSVSRQRREIGIRMALGARRAHVLRRVTAEVAVMICLGSAIGLAGGLASGRMIEALLFEVKATDFGMIVTPILTLAVVALVAALPPAMRAVRIDPAQTLRSD